MKKRQSDLRLRRRRLRLRHRPQNSGDNTAYSSSLFARLSPSMVSTLQTDALCRLQHEGQQTAETETETGVWSVSSPKAQSTRVEFLPLSVKFSPDLTVYVSYNGGLASVGKDADILELPTSVIPEGFDENCEVHVAALPSIRDADILNVEPLTYEDWELLETRAEFLESGALLRQVSVVYAGQVIPLWVGAKDCAWIRILHDNFGDEDSLWPVESGSIAAIGGNCCLRLVQDTRVCIAPKPRPNVQRGKQWSPPIRVYPTAEDYSAPMIDLAEYAGRAQISTSPGTAFVHSTMKAAISGLNEDDMTAPVVIWNAANEIETDSSDPRKSCLLQLAFCDKIPVRHIALHRLTRSRLGLIALVDAVFLRVLSPIEVARGSTLMSQDVDGLDKPFVLTKLEIQESRRGDKWRFPYDSECKQQQKSTQVLSRVESIIDVCSVNASEPFEEGSFLPVDTNVEKAQMYCIARTTSGTMVTSHSRDGEKKGNIASTSLKDRCFVMGEELRQLLKPNAAPHSVIYDNIYTPQILNLLPEISLISPDLLKHFRSGMVDSDALVFGDVGSGKTHTALVLAAMARFSCSCATFYLDCKKLKEGRGIRMKRIISELNQVFHEAASCRWHAIVCLDGLDDLAPNMEDGGSGVESAQSQQANPIAVDQAKLLGDTVYRLIDRSPFSSDGRVSIIITCRHSRSLYPPLLMARPFILRIEAPNLDVQEREILLWRMISSGTKWSDNSSCPDEFKLQRIGRKTEGYRPRDLQLLASRVINLLHRRNDKLSPEDIAGLTNEALECFIPLRQLSLNEGNSGSVDWTKEIGGIFGAKEELISAILNPAKYHRIYERAKIRLPRGVLLFGYPGCGKTLLIPALAKKCGFNLITCRGPELLDRYIGASEAKVREMFARAAAASPSILFFDEIDSLAPRRGSDRTGVTDRVVNQLLTLLDGVEDSSAKGLVYIIAATSRPDIIDPALLRPGRLEKHVYVGFSESDEECIDLFLKIASRYSVEPVVYESISSGDLVRDIRSSFANSFRLSGADLKAVFDTAQLNAIHELLQTGRPNDNLTIKQHHLRSALHSTRPSLPQRDYEMFQEAYRPFRKNDSKGRVGDGDSASGTSRHHQTTKLKTALR